MTAPKESNPLELNRECRSFVTLHFAGLVQTCSSPDRVVRLGNSNQGRAIQQLLFGPESKIAEFVYI
jgi:hypothetical protein